MKVIIIGAGAAGLMAGKILKEKGIEFIILEASDHIGGRAQTIPGSPHIELGPEFLHGKTPETDKLLEQYGIPYYDMQFDYHLYKDGKLERLSDFWESMCGVIGGIKFTGEDLPFAEYLKRYDHHSKDDQALAKSFVQGFDAADLDRISTRALSEMKDQVCDPDIRKMRRPLHGYGELMNKMSEEIIDSIKLSHEVTSIEWKKNEVTVSGKHFMFRSEKLLDTASIGVLKKQKITPKPNELSHFLEQVEMGQVVKIIAEVDPQFFHQFEDNTFPFISSPELSFTAWWTTTPIHTNLITGWAGGEKARGLSELSLVDKEAVFLDELSKVTSLDVRRYVKNIHMHNWNEDPFFQGAYSYPKVVHGKKAETKTSFEETLYFAGEAFHEEFSGTIEGALLTGKIAAENLAKDF